MTAATTSLTSAAGRSWPRRWVPALAGLAIVVPAVTACASSASTPAPAPAAASSSPAPASSAAAFPGVVGTAAAVSGSSMEVQNPTSGQVTVTFTATTPITETVAVTSQDVTAGSCVTVVGAPSATGAATGAATRSVTATTVTVSPPVNGSCSGTGGFGGAGGFGGPRGTFTPNPSSSPRPRPSGSRGAFGGGFGGGANGKVTSLTASGFVVQGRNPAAGAGVSITVTTTAATRYLKVVTVGPSALKVGECITAAGQANSIGAIAARSIRISQPGPNGCVTGFGGRRGSGRPSSNA
jgi:hypothetical protein